MNGIIKEIESLRVQKSHSIWVIVAVDEKPTMDEKPLI